MRPHLAPAGLARSSLALITAAALATVLAAWAAAATPFLDTLPKQSVVATTVPSNGDVNPYGVAVVPSSTGHLIKGDVLVSNFNAKSNLQGTGKTIVEISPSGSRRLFASIDRSNVPGCTGGVGLTTALVALRSGWVVVGSLPTSDGMSATAKAGCLIVLNSNGKVAETFQGHGINGPWDMTAIDAGSNAWLFVSNVLNGTVAAKGATVNRGTVLRIHLVLPPSGMPKMVDSVVIGSGFAEMTDPSALVIGPTGLAVSGGNLFVADTASNRIAEIGSATTRMNSAGRGSTVSSGLHLMQPLGLVVAPGGDILTVNAGDGNIVETTRSGHQVATRQLDATGAGTLFGLAVAPGGRGVYFVDDGSNNLQLLH